MQSIAICFIRQISLLSNRLQAGGKLLALNCQFGLHGFRWRILEFEKSMKEDHKSEANGATLVVVVGVVHCDLQ